MTSTVSVPRELLADLLGNDHDKRIMAERHLLAMLANTPSPAGVDGLEVVGWVNDIGRFILGKNGYEAGCNEPFVEEDLCRLSDAQAIIDGLRDQIHVAHEKVGRYADRRDQQAQRIGELEGLLREALEALWVGERDLALFARIDAALSAGKEGE